MSKFVTQTNSLLQARQHTSTEAVGYLSKAGSQKPPQAVLSALNNNNNNNNIHFDIVYTYISKKTAKLPQ